MADIELFSQYLQSISRSVPRDAIALRSASAQIISKWIIHGFEYPDDLIDIFVYTESSIENSIADNVNDAVALEIECSGAYKFHIGNFLEALGKLQTVMEELKAR